MIREGREEKVSEEGEFQREDNDGLRTMWREGDEEGEGGRGDNEEEECRKAWKERRMKKRRVKKTWCNSKMNVTRE